jgi:uncharacterized membrane protein
MGEARQQHPRIASELPLLLALRRYGERPTRSEGRGGDDPAGYADCGPHADRRTPAGRDHALARHQHADGRRELASLPVPGLPQQRHSWTMVAWGTRALDAGVATILNSTAPIFTFFLTFAITRHETVTARKLVGVVAGMVGICLIVGVQALAGLGEQLAAQIALLLAAVCYAGAAIFGRNFRDLDPMAPAAGSLLCGRRDPDPAEHCGGPAVDAGAVDEFAARAVGARGVFHGVRLRDLFPPDPDAGSVGATAQAYLRVPIGVAASVVFLGEQLSPTVWIGLACVVVGVAAMTIPQRKAAIA